MTKMKRITSLFLSLVMLLSVFSGFGMEVYAASKPNRTSIKSVTVDGGETTVVINKVKGGKFTDSCVDYYAIQYSTDSSFKSGVNTIATSDYTDTKAYIEELFVPFENVYFRVRTYRQYYKQVTKNVSWSKKPQKVWTPSTLLCSNWSATYTYNVPVDSYGGMYDAGAYAAHVYAQRVIAECGITSNMSDLEKVARVQKWINNHWWYDNQTDVGNVDDFYSLLYRCNFGACSEFAWTFSSIMKELGIPCKSLVRSESLGAITSHEWNLIYIDGYWWHYDCESFSEKSYPVEFRSYTNSSNFQFSNYSNGITNTSKQILQRCQPNGSEIGIETVRNMNYKFNALVASV